MNAVKQCLLFAFLSTLFILPLHSQAQEGWNVRLDARAIADGIGRRVFDYAIMAEAPNYQVSFQGGYQLGGQVQYGFKNNLSVRMGYFYGRRLGRQDMGLDADRHNGATHVATGDYMQTHEVPITLAYRFRVGDTKLHLNAAAGAAFQWLEELGPDGTNDWGISNPGYNDPSGFSAPYGTYGELTHTSADVPNTALLGEIGFSYDYGRSGIFGIDFQYHWVPKKLMNYRGAFQRDGVNRVVIAEVRPSFLSVGISYTFSLQALRTGRSAKSEDS